MDFALPTNELESAFRDGKGLTARPWKDLSDRGKRPRHQPRGPDLPPSPVGIPGILPGHQVAEGTCSGLLTPDGRHYEGDTRHILKKTLAVAREEFGFDDFQGRSRARILHLPLRDGHDL